MKKTALKYFILLLVLFGAANLFSQSFDEELKKAENFYSAGKYEQSLEIYDSIASQGFQSAGLFYNIGNAYYRLNKFTDAIYWYEKAKIIAPSDNEIETNLYMANLQIYDKINPKPEFYLTSFFRNLIQSQSSKFWGVLSIVSFIFLAALILFYLFSRTSLYKKISFYSAVLMFIISISTFIFAQKQYSYQNSDKYAIVYSPSVSVKSSPEFNAKELLNIHEGLKVEILESSNDWLEIRLPDGREGWLKKETVKLL